MFRQMLLAVLIGLVLGVPSAAQAALDDLVLIKGNGTDTAAMSFSQGNTNYFADFSAVCKSILEYMSANGLVDTAAGYVGPGAEMMNMMFGGDEVGGALPSVEAARALVDCKNEPPAEHDYTIMFTTCSMHMWSGGYLLTWAVPPGVTEPLMSIVDAESKRLITGALLESHMALVPEAAQGEATRNQSVDGPNGFEDWVVLVARGSPGAYTRTAETYSAGIYDFKYEGRVSFAGGEGMGLSLGRIISDGKAHLVSDFPGSDVIGKFYLNFRNEVVPALQAGSLMTQLFEQMADLADRGVPVHTEQTITMGGGLMTMIGSAGAGEGSTSTNTVTHVGVWEGGAAENALCGHSVAPEGWEQSSLDEMMAGAAGGQGGSGSTLTAEQQAQVNQGTAAMQQALSGMTDEQKAALSGLGLEGLIPGIGAEPAAAPAGATASAASSAPSSDSLMTDDITQSVQKHLQALGYDTGNTDGTLSNETVIAISQFQFEKGMDVTGEVTPQLLGVLGAEVDSRR